MVDANRDGAMSFTEPTIHDKDGTTKDKPFTFWINNDNDRGATVDGSDWEQDDYAGDHDRTDYAIHWRRDLEDFTRLWISFKGIVDLVKQPDMQVKLEWKPAEGETWNSQTDGTPAINIAEAYEPDGGNKYLFDDATAWSQLDGLEGGIAVGDPRYSWKSPVIAGTPLS